MFCDFDVSVVSEMYSCEPESSYMVLLYYAAGVAWWVQCLDCVLDNRGILVRLPVEARCFLFSKTSRGPRKPTQPPVICVPGFFL